MEIVPNLQSSPFGLKVRTKGPRPSICVRTFSLFTTFFTKVDGEPWLVMFSTFENNIQGDQAPSKDFLKLLQLS